MLHQNHLSHPPAHGALLLHDGSETEQVVEPLALRLVFFVIEKEVNHELQVFLSIHNG